MAQPWISVQKLAVVPAFNRQFDTAPPPSDWDSLIMRRVLYDPDPATGADRSLRSYLGAISYGRATLDAKLFPHAFSDGPSVIEAAFQSLPSGHGRAPPRPTPPRPDSQCGLACSGKSVPRQNGGHQYRYSGNTHSAVHGAWPRLG